MLARAHVVPAHLLGVLPRAIAPYLPPSPAAHRPGRADSMVRWVAAFTGDREFTEAVDQFTHDHAGEFKSAGDDADGSGYSLEHTALYHKFLELTESKIESFLETKGWSPEKFYRECRKSVEAADSAGRISVDAFFVQTLLACSEFDQFITMMKRVHGALVEVREGMENSASNMLTFMDDAEEVSKDDREEVRGYAREALSFLEDNPSASMAQVLAAQEKFDTAVLPVMKKYTGGDEAASDLVFGRPKGES